MISVLGAIWAAVLIAAIAFMYVVPSPAIGRLGSDKAAYVGAWKSHTLRLRIERDGTIDYSRSSDLGNTHYGGKIRGFEGDDFTVLIPPIFPGRFHVTEPPHQVDGRWQMVVDGISVTRD